MNRRRWMTVLVACAVALAAAAGAVASGAIWPGRIFAAGQSVRGVDVSEYQGTIDWPVLADQGLDFAYVKATEGSSSVDSQFEANLTGATKAGLLVGAYHFLSFESSGEAQAQHIIDTVPKGTDLPIAVDVELYGGFSDDPPTRAEVEAILDPLLSALKAHYGRTPLIYATADSYRRYISGAHDENPIWIRSVFLPPSLNDGRTWTIWQYSNRDRLSGYDGNETFIDMNAFNGTRSELAALVSRN